MAKHKYIRKYLSKNGKWVYVYSDSAKKSNGSVGLSDFINARAQRRESINKARSRVANKAIHMATAKARRAYSDCRRQAEAYKKRPGFNKFMEYVVTTAASQFGFVKRS